MQRDYDIVVFGATGFTGKLVAEYLARSGPQTLKWALAGRSVSKLEHVRKGLEAIRPELGSLPIVQASSEDAGSLVALARRTRVLLTTVGPYTLHGEPVLRACTEASTDYVDITGEPQFVRNSIETFDAIAREKKVRIVHCCGFDSLPHDAGAYFTVKQLDQTKPIALEGFVRTGGSTFSGGTWNSALEIISRGKKTASAVPRVKTARKVQGQKPRLFFDREFRAWACPLPTIDPQIVLRSASALDAYGPVFSYAHYAQIRFLATVIGGAAGIGAIVALAQLKPTRKLLARMRPSGEGPTDKQLKNGWFQVTFRARSGDRTMVTRVSGGEPGYAETSKMIAECALSLVSDRERLPAQYGVLTPVVALGDVIVERLKTAGMKFEVLRDS